MSLSDELAEVREALLGSNDFRCGVCSGHSPSWDGHVAGGGRHCSGWAMERLDEIIKREGSAVVDRDGISEVVNMWVGRSREKAKHDGLVKSLISAGYHTATLPTASEFEALFDKIVNDFATRASDVSPTNRALAEAASVLIRGSSRG